MIAELTVVTGDVGERSCDATHAKKAATGEPTAFDVVAQKSTRRF
jgi:hypothetical protein